MKKVLLSLLLVLLCQVKSFACYPDPESVYDPCLTTEWTPSGAVQYITVLSSHCYGDAIDPTLPWGTQSHGYLWYQPTVGGPILGPLAPYSETWDAGLSAWVIKYQLPVSGWVAQYECARFWFEMWPNTHIPTSSPPISYYQQNDPGTVVCPCDAEEL
jgi:hypothetical protein